LLWGLRDRLAPARLFGLFAILFGLERLLVEFVRFNDELFAGLTAAQLWSAALSAVGVVRLLRGGRHGATPARPATATGRTGHVLRDLAPACSPCATMEVVVRSAAKIPRRLGGILLAASVLAGCGGQADGDAAVEPRGTAGQPASQLLDGGPEAFKARLAELRGTPVVVNQWASWCGPCRYEFPFLARQATALEGRVAFLGVNTQDSRKAARRFLQEVPVPFPHFFDPEGDVARVFRGGRAFPTTAFYAASGKLVFTHMGAYPDERALEADIRRYALGG
jgi:cytochrome c biogenesis protein CcmG, thiol:disulfide interchange protein DsbE